jgi:hypothetical protein
MSCWCVGCGCVARRTVLLWVSFLVLFNSLSTIGALIVEFTGHDFGLWYAFVAHSLSTIPLTLECNGHQSMAMLHRARALHAA